MLETYGKMVSGGEGGGQCDGSRHETFSASVTVPPMEVLLGKEGTGDMAGNWRQQPLCAGNCHGCIPCGYSLNVQDRGWCSRVKDDESECQIMPSAVMLLVSVNDGTQCV